MRGRELDVSCSLMLNSDLGSISVSGTDSSLEVSALPASRVASVCLLMHLWRFRNAGMTLAREYRISTRVKVGSSIIGSIQAVGEAGARLRLAPFSLVVALLRPCGGPYELR